MRATLKEIDEKINALKKRQRTRFVYKGGPIKYDVRSMIVGLTMAWDIVAKHSVQKEVSKL